MASEHRQDPTRDALLRCAYEKTYRAGFRATGLNDILAETGVTKGALYHHFRSKTELGYAMIDEYVARDVRRTWIEPVQRAKTAVAGLRASIEGVIKRASPKSVAYGCPLNNLALELAAVNEQFRARIDAIFDEWRGVVEEGLSRDQEARIVRENVDADTAAAFIVASIEGALCMAKSAQSRAMLVRCFDGLLSYIDGLQSGESGREKRALGSNRTRYRTSRP